MITIHNNSSLAHRGSTAEISKPSELHSEDLETSSAIGPVTHPVETSVVKTSQLRPVTGTAETGSSDSSTSQQKGEATQQGQETLAAASSERQAAQQKEAQIRQFVQKLSARDREVRAHEQAHAAVGGQYTGAPTYTYQRGPDGRNYAVGGEVQIDTSAVQGDPRSTLEKAQLIRRAALAPQDPSPQDRLVAAEAVQMAAQARVELARMQAEQRSAQAENNEPSRQASQKVSSGQQAEDNNASTQADNDAVVNEYEITSRTTGVPSGGLSSASLATDSRGTAEDMLGV